MVLVATVLVAVGVGQGSPPAQPTVDEKASLRGGGQAGTNACPTEADAAVRRRASVPVAKAGTVARRSSRLAILLPLLLFVALASYGEKAKSSAAVRPAPVKVTSVEGITEYRLSNGLRVLLFPDPTKATVSQSIITILAGQTQPTIPPGRAQRSSPSGRTDVITIQ